MLSCRIKCKFLGTNVTNKNSFQEEIKSRLSQGMLVISRCRIFVFQFVIKNIKIKIEKTVILPVVLYGCETWSLTLREKRRLRMFENRILRRMFGSKRDEVTRGMEKIT